MYAAILLRSHVGVKKPIKDTLDMFVESLLSGKVNFKDIPTLKPVFRLHPPRKGHKGIKKSFKNGGELGYHGDKINDLLLKMR